MSDNIIPITPEEENFFSQLDIPFGKSKGDIWNEINEAIEDSPKAVEPRPVRHLLRWSAAAITLLLVGFSLFIKFYTTTIQTTAKVLSHQLPDGSSIDLNVNSNLTYHPYWWNFDRSIQFEGEGFFDVQKGSKFSVVSQIGSTEVLGTSFNISSNQQRYEVLCVTGKVKVTNHSNGESVLITPNMMATVEGAIKVDKNVDPAFALAWKAVEFNFDTTPLNEVFAALEKAYHVNIDFKGNNTSLTHTAYFKKPTSADVAINLICQSFGLTFVKLDDTHYKVSQK